MIDNHDIPAADSREPNGSHDYPATIVSGGPSARAAWDQFISSKNPGTMAVYRTIASRFFAWFERQGTGLAEMSPDHIEQFLATLDLTISSRQSYRSPLRQFLSALARTAAPTPSPNDSAGISEENQPPGRDQKPKSTKVSQFEREFAALSDIEKQATVDAAAMALSMHAVHTWICTIDPRQPPGDSVDVAKCERTLELGRSHGITPLSWFKAP